MENEQKHILLFDGVCNLCDSTVQFVNKHDQKNQFLFQSLQSEDAQQLMKGYGVDDVQLKSMVLISNGKLHTKSSAALTIAGLLGFPYTMTQVFFIIPKPLRDAVYDVIARNRYRWFGQKDTCTLDPNFQNKIYGRSTN